MSRSILFVNARLADPRAGVVQGEDRSWSTA